MGIKLAEMNIIFRLVM